jgi:hypothetical protein
VLDKTEYLKGLSTKQSWDEFQTNVAQKLYMSLNTVLFRPTLRRASRDTENEDFGRDSRVALA